MSQHGIIIFHSSSMAIKAERTLSAGGMTVKLIPTPRELSSDCGLALQFDWSCRENVEQIIHDNKIIVAAMTLFSDR